MRPDFTPFELDFEYTFEFGSLFVNGTALLLCYL
jgi:hypothetical protein